MSEFHANPVTQDVLDAIKDDKHVLIDWKPTLDLLMKTEYGKTKRCEYAIGIEEFYTERIALAFPIGNPWIERFDERYALFALLINLDGQFKIAFQNKQD